MSRWVARKRKTSWLLSCRSFTPRWAAEWSSRIIPCIFQESKITPSGDTPSIKGGCHNRVPVEGRQEVRAGAVRARWNAGNGVPGVAAGLSDGGIERESLELTSQYFNRWPFRLRQTTKHMLSEQTRAVWHLCRAIFSNSFEISKSKL